MIDFKSFVKNPLTAILFLSLVALSYLYVDNKSVYEGIIDRHEEQIQDLKGELKSLRDDYNALNNKFIDTIRNLE